MDYCGLPFSVSIGLLSHTHMQCTQTYKHRLNGHCVHPSPGWVSRLPYSRLLPILTGGFGCEVCLPGANRQETHFWLHLFCIPLDVSSPTPIPRAVSRASFWTLPSGAVAVERRQRSLQHIYALYNCLLRVRQITSLWKMIHTWSCYYTRTL